LARLDPGEPCLCDTNRRTATCAAARASSLPGGPRRRDPSVSGLSSGREEASWIRTRCGPACGDLGLVGAELASWWTPANPRGRSHMSTGVCSYREWERPSTGPDTDATASSVVSPFRNGQGFFSGWTFFAANNPGNNFAVAR
jgi:hypothetical protein